LHQLNIDPVIPRTWSVLFWLMLVSGSETSFKFLVVVLHMLHAGIIFAKEHSIVQITKEAK